MGNALSYIGVKDKKGTAIIKKKCDVCVAYLINYFVNLHRSNLSIL